MVGKRDEPAAENSNGPIRTPLPPVALPTLIPLEPPIRSGDKEENDPPADADDEGKLDEKDEPVDANGNAKVNQNNIKKIK